MTTPFILKLTTLVLCCLVKSALCQQNSTFSLNIPGIVKLAWSFMCEDPYFDISAVGQLRFVRSELATVPPHHQKIGDGHQLQCRNSEYCKDFAPSQAFCFRSANSDKGQWRCTAVIYNDNIEMTGEKIKCQEVEAWDPNCFYKDSCVLFYSFTNRSASLTIGKMFGWVAIGFALFFFSLALCACVRRHSNRSNDTPTPNIIRHSADSRRTYMTSEVQPSGHTIGVYDIPPSLSPPPYQQSYQEAPGVPSTMRLSPTSLHQSVTMVQPAINPAFSDECLTHATYDPPPPYYTTCTGYRDQTAKQ